MDGHPTTRVDRPLDGPAGRPDGLAFDRPSVCPAGRPAGRPAGHHATTASDAPLAPLKSATVEPSRAEPLVARHTGGPDVVTATWTVVQELDDERLRV